MDIEFIDSRKEAQCGQADGCGKWRETVQMSRIELWRFFCDVNGIESTSTGTQQKLWLDKKGNC